MLNGEGCYPCIRCELLVVFPQRGKESDLTAITAWFDSKTDHQFIKGIL